MKLGKLLGLGKSFFGGNRDASYQVNRRASLPKFNEGKNPFTAKQAAPATAEVIMPAKAATIKPMTAAAPAINPPPAPIKSIAPKAQNKFLAGGHTGKAVANPAGQVTSPSASRPGRPGWTTRLNPFRAPAPESDAAQTVQAELSLDAVKVVHNDLADADVEVVPVKSRNSATATPPALGPARQAWECLGENVLKSA